MGTTISMGRASSGFLVPITQTKYVSYDINIFIMQGPSKTDSSLVNRGPTLRSDLSL